MLHGLDADDGHDAGSFELTPGVAEEGLHGSGIEPAADLVRACDGEAFTGCCEQAAALELFLQSLASASAPLSTASAWPIASARASFERL